MFFISRNQKKENDLANMLTQLKNLEAALTSKDVEFTKLASDHRRLNDNFTDLQSQLENVG